MASRRESARNSGSRAMLTGLSNRRSKGEGREWRIIDLLSEVLGPVGKASTRTRPVVGIGDDAAVLRAPGETSLVWTIDAVVEEVHFRREWLSFRDIGWRATQAAVSDIAAMGARPVAALCHLVVPPHLQRRELRQLGQGQAEAAKDLGCPVIGGNISSGARLELATTVLGEMPPRKTPLLRDGARPGHEIWLLGEVGFAAAGLRALLAGRGRQRSLGEALRAWRRPRALVQAGLQLQGRARSCIDVSDGLVGDATHVARASGVAFVLEEERIRDVSAPLEQIAQHLGATARELVLWGGEDYALLATGPAKRRPSLARPIGRVEAGDGVWLESSSDRIRLEGGYQHLRGTSR